MTKCDQDEVERRNARNNLDEFLNSEIKNIEDPHRLSKINSLRTWDSGSKVEYERKLKMLTEIAEKGELKRVASSKMFDRENFKMIKKLQKYKLWTNGSTEENTKKLEQLKQNANKHD